VLDTLREGMANGMDYEPVHGQLLNIEASRIAHHLGARGVNYIVDAACATSFAALDCAAKELLSGACDMVISGGVNTNLAPESFVGFSKMGALSAKGSYPFDGRADGFVLGEGAGVVVLKRMKDALRDGDRIYAVLKGIGASSDGKGKAIAAPNPAGQALALQRCYENMRDPVTVADIDYIEAHGTSTIAGDQAEIETLKKIYRRDRPIGVSSVKSQIGHLLGGAGYAGMIKAILAINHHTLPPNGRFESLAPAHAIEDSPLYIIEEAQDWQVDPGRPRMAAVSSYGFGGINYHCVIAERTPEYRPLPRRIFADLDYDFNDDRIVFAGLGVVLPESPDVDTFWQNLSEGRSVLSAIPEDRFHNRAYADEPVDSTYHIPQVKAGVVKDYRFNNVKFRIPPATARSLDRAQFFALDAAQQAINAAALTPQLSHGNRVGVILGTLPGERQVQNILRVRLGVIQGILSRIDGIEEGTKKTITTRLTEQIRDRIPENNEDTIPGLLSNIVSGRIANTFGCNGANFVVDASCASATVATHLAVRGLQNGEFDSVLTGGVDANFYPTVMLAFKRLGLLSDDDCRFFDKQAKGYVMSEGAAVHVMTTYGYAKKHNMPIIGEFYHSEFHSSGPDHLLAPSEKTYRDTMRACYRRLPVNAHQVDHLDVFGVANVFLDQMEKQAIEKTFPRPVFYGNIKPEFGYFKSANPAVAMTKLLLMNRSQTMLPHYSYTAESSIVDPDSGLTANPRVKNMTQRQSLVFAANVNGVGGNHGHTVIGTLPPWLRSKDQPASLATATTSRPPRQAAIIPMKPNGVVALVSGQGAQYSGMLQELYRENRTIREIMDRGNQIFQDMRGYSLLDIMFGESRLLNLTENTQPAVFLSSAAIYTDLAARGFSPDRFIGHSVGEYTALYCAGMLDFEPAMRLIVKRADFMKAATEVQPGRIMVVFKNADSVLQLIRDARIQNIYVANKNSENQTAVSGAQEAIEAFAAYLKTAKVMFKALALSGAFHTPLFQSASEKMADYLQGVTFRPVDFHRVISNVTAEPYPEDADAVKTLLVRQIVSPVEFIHSVEQVYRSGHNRFFEIGPGRILVNLLKNINIDDFQALPSVNAKAGEVASLQDFKTQLETQGLLKKQTPTGDTGNRIVPVPEPTTTPSQPAMADAEDFDAFLAKNEDALRGVLYQEFLKQKREQALREVENFNFYTGKAVISGTAIGLPGTGNKVFNANNFDKILEGNNFIEPLSTQEKEKIVDMNITRVFKQPDGNARFLEITDTRDVIQLAGKLGYFNLENEYGVNYDYDITISLAIAAGIEALKDAQIPLVLQHKKTSTGQHIPSGYALPRELQKGTGVIMTSLFPGFETLIEQLNRYYYNKFYVRPYKELENIYYHLMESVRDSDIKEQITDWFFKIKERRKKYGTYKFERNLLFDVVPLGSAHFAQLIKAKGPNMLMSGACASTTQAIGVAEDWIRTGRCDRVIVIGGESSTSETQSPWIASGFLALGAASIKNVVSEAAKPFDADRNGTILGAGAVSLIVEREDRVRDRGLNGQAEILGTYIGNSAYHATQIDLGHLTEEMEGFVRRVENRHGLQRDHYTRSMVFMSHETFTPARGGSASAEVASLKKTFPDNYRDITITNTKGYTGHTLGAAIEDAVMVKALQKHQVPPIANLTNIPEEFQDLRFSQGPSKGPFEYGLHYAAGFGSHFAFLMIRRIEEKLTADNLQYQAWLQQISGLKRPRLTTINNTLCIDPNVISPVTDAPHEPVPAGAPSTKPAPATQPSAAIATPPAPSVDVLATVKAIIAEQTGYTTDMLEDELDLEADLGIDTVKQVEIFGKVSERFGLEVPEDLKLRDLNTIAKLADYLGRQIPAGGIDARRTAHRGSMADPAAAAGPIDVLATVKAIIAEQTGYTTDMLEDELDLEADLGIDTVKQVEIFGKVSERFGLEVPEDLKLRDLNTIAKLADYLGRQIPAGEPATAQPTAAAPDPAAAAGPDVLATVKAIIAEQTGYTTDMLEDELDLEADLGIDTVKQVEIFGKVSERFGLEVPEDLKLRDLNTIAKLADYLGRQIPSGNTATEAPATTPADEISEPTVADAVPIDGPVKRLIITTAAVAAAPATTPPMTGQTILITSGGDRYAAIMAEKVASRGGRAIIAGSGEGADIPCNWQNPQNVKTVLTHLQEIGDRIDGVIHLIPLERYPDADAMDQHRINGGLKSFFILIQGLFDQLNRPGTFIAMPSMHSTIFPYRENGGAIDPLMAGLAGMLKTVNKELADTRVKVVDFAAADPLADMEERAETFLDEVLSGDPRVECGYANGKKYVLQLVPRVPAENARFIHEGDTLLVTGGARGITFEILKALVASVKIKLVILGRSDLDDLDPAMANPAIDAAAIMARLKTTMPDAKPITIKQALNRTLSTRASIANLDALRALGATVAYHPVDVTDAEAVAAAVATAGPLDGVLHAAGLEESQFIPKKTLASFRPGVRHQSDRASECVGGLG
jgi:malonyl CoA-acyl carrier protein transacylase